MVPRLSITIMSGVDDGLRLSYSQDNGDGEFKDGHWLVGIGRREDRDICLRHDRFVSRVHANIFWDSDRWWLEDCGSANGTFLELDDNEARISGIIPIDAGQLFRIGRTWMRIEAEIVE